MSIKTKKITTIVMCLVVIAGSGIFIASRVLGVTVGGTLTMGGNIDMQSSFKVINLATPGANADAANKLYVDTLIKGTGQANYLPKWNSAFSGLEKSKLYQSGVDLAADASLGIFDMTKHEIRNMRLHNTVTDPALPATGQIWICTDAPGANATNYDCI